MSLLDTYTRQELNAPAVGSVGSSAPFLAISGVATSNFKGGDFALLTDLGIVAPVAGGAIDGVVIATFNEATPPELRTGTIMQSGDIWVAFTGTTPVVGEGVEVVDQFSVKILTNSGTHVGAVKKVIGNSILMRIL